MTNTLYIEVCHLPESSLTKDLSERPQIYSRTSLFPSLSQPTYIFIYISCIIFEGILTSVDDDDLIQCSTDYY